MIIAVVLDSSTPFGVLWFSSSPMFLNGCSNRRKAVPAAAVEVKMIKSQVEDT
jgi:hypothetical protein